MESLKEQIKHGLEGINEGLRKISIAVDYHLSSDANIKNARDDYVRLLETEYTENNEGKKKKRIEDLSAKIEESLNKAEKRGIDKNGFDILKQFYGDIFLKQVESGLSMSKEDIGYELVNFRIKYEMAKKILENPSNVEAYLVDIE